LLKVYALQIWTIDGLINRNSRFHYYSAPIRS
jgi:hypothetical protein